MLRTEPELLVTPPLWSIAFGLALGSKRGLRLVRLTGLLLGFGGTVVIFAPWQATGATGWGALAILGAAASYAVSFTYMGRALVGRAFPPSRSPLPSSSPRAD
ncbi:hypothetical protein AB0E81_19250 [Streptomyces sp. NPDC033538]|uniref:hypothetical protein n=1 Tax=Streptomyces sp. NPDC033538 TaxID=3155367 RepID=UPI0033C5CE01